MQDTNEPSPSEHLQELELVTYLLRKLQELPVESRKRVLSTAAQFFGIGYTQSGDLHSQVREPTAAAPPNVSTSNSFSADRSISPKQFMFQKQPRTDVEKVACLAYYLTHYLETPHFKTLDISKLNTEAAQVKFSNPAVAVENATKLRYLVPATKGNKQLSALGEQFVHVLPDRDRAKQLMTQVRPRRKSKRIGEDMRD